MEAVLTDLVESRVPKLGQDPSQQETIAHHHHERNNESLDDQAPSQRQVNAAGGSCNQPVQDVQRAAPPDYSGPAGIAPPADIGLSRQGSFPRPPHSPAGRRQHAR